MAVSSQLDRRLAVYLIAQCSNCGRNMRRELGVATATTLQHRKCADRFGLGTHGQPMILSIARPIRHHLLGPTRPPAVRI